MKTNHNQTIAQNVMRQIESGKVAMRPRWHFALLGISGAIFSTALIVVAVYLANLVVYKIRQETRGLNGRGLGSGLGYLAGNFPWLALLVGLASLSLLIWAIRRFDFSYRAGRWAVVAIVLVCLAVGSALAFTNLNSHLENYGPMQRLYGQHMQSQGQSSQGQNAQQNGDMMQRGSRGGQNN